MVVAQGISPNSGWAWTFHVPGSDTTLGYIGSSPQECYLNFHGRRRVSGFWCLDRSDGRSHRQTKSPLFFWKMRFLSDCKCFIEMKSDIKIRGRSLHAIVRIFFNLFIFYNSYMGRAYVFFHCHHCYTSRVNVTGMTARATEKGRVPLNLLRAAKSIFSKHPNKQLPLQGWKL